MKSQSWLTPACAFPEAPEIRVKRRCASVKSVLRRWSVAVSFGLLSMGARAEIETRCLAFWGDVYISPLGAAGYIYDEPLFMRSATEMLSGLDLVVNGLRLQGVTSVPPANWSLPFSWVDASGHALIATYLDPERDGRANVKGLITSALEGL